ncbi:Vacuolar protein sorting-associated protein 33A [Psilocybe cubensis]|uniref:Vacuolar protein sorting-associated protein 33A n=1 Tax=Psilocybe cubensis TaxID=181762 RepID=A0ACB8HEV2_PSICU|nr:Vacuolar protein sorting-associated protein 33A [Psilocybe cubensis]KAH9486328.1 Vacuolar protein sorting-associated protein 33A [Psilocybe cubensis]
MASGEQASTSSADKQLDVNILKEIAKKDLVNGAKTLVLDASLAGPLGLVTEVSLLKHHGVDKMFWLEPGPLTSSTNNIVYICRPRIKHVKIIADHIKRHAKESRKHNYTLLLVPRVSTLVSRILEEEGVLGDVTISSYNLQFIPIAEDVISLEHENTLRELWVDGDETIIYDSAQALLNVQRIFGHFPQIIGKGDYAQARRLATLLSRQNPKASNGSSPEPLSSSSSKIDSLIILDRRVDMITPLLTQLTYEGLVDELVGIKNCKSFNTTAGATSAPTASTSTTPAAIPVVAVKKDAKKKHHLTTATDPLFAELRDLNFSSVGKKLNQVARRLNEDYKTNLQGQTVAQLRDFVGKLGGLQTEHQALGLHTRLSELIVPLTRTDVFNKSLEIQQNLLASYEVTAQLNAIEDLIAQGADMQIVLRLLCLASLTAGGVKAKNLENIKREILQAYGYEYLPLLLSLSAPSLSVLFPNPLPPSTPSSVAALKYPFAQLRKSLRLLIDDNPEALDEVENDISFVYSGYAPISVRLVQCIAQKGGVISNPAEKEKASNEANSAGDQKKLSIGKVQAHPIVGWKGFEDVVSVIPGQTVEIVQKTSNNVVASGPLAALGSTTTTTVVFFLGGCTYTEIAALRWVGRQNKGRKFLVATTGIVSGASIIEGIAGIGQSAGPKTTAATV